MGGVVKSWWRPVISGICIVLAAIALIGSIATHYLRDNILNTDGYLAIVGPLPADPAVANALATFTTTKIFDAQATQSAIQSFLPPRLAPLADPLTNELQKRVNERTKTFVEGDEFSAIWTGANRVAQKALLRVADSKGSSRSKVVSSVNIDKLLSAARQHFGDNQTVFSNQQQDKLAAIRVNLHESAQQLRTTVQLIRNGAYVLPYIFLALLLLALAVGYNRRRLLLAIGAALVVVAVVLVIVLKAASQSLLGDIQNSGYRAAADVVYEAFYGNLRARFVGCMIGGFAIVALALAAGPYGWAVRFRRAVGITSFKR